MRAPARAATTCRAQDAPAPPPSRIAATFSRRSATSARIAAAFAANASERRSSEVVRTAIGAVHLVYAWLDRASGNRRVQHNVPGTGGFHRAFSPYVSQNSPQSSPALLAGRRGVATPPHLRSHLQLIGAS